MPNAQTPTEKSKKHRDNIKNATKNFDYTAVSDRLRTVSRSNSSHPTGVVKRILWGANLPTHCNAIFMNIVNEAKAYMLKYIYLNYPVIQWIKK